METREYGEDEDGRRWRKAVDLTRPLANQFLARAVRLVLFVTMVTLRGYFAIHHFENIEG
jgi:hypothetical protein